MRRLEGYGKLNESLGMMGGLEIKPLSRIIDTNRVEQTVQQRPEFMAHNVFTTLTRIWRFSFLSCLVHVSLYLHSMFGHAAPNHDELHHVSP